MQGLEFTIIGDNALLAIINGDEFWINFDENNLY